MTGIIVVGVDGSETALRAAQTARDLAVSLGATLHVVSAFDSGAGAAASIDAWVDPPPYTGLPLTSLRVGDDSTIRVPRGSVLNLRVHGAPRTPGLAAGNNVAPRFTPLSPIPCACVTCF